MKSDRVVKTDVISIVAKTEVLSTLRLRFNSPSPSILYHFCGSLEQNNNITHISGTVHQSENPLSWDFSNQTLLRSMNLHVKQISRQKQTVLRGTKCSQSYLNTPRIGSPLRIAVLLFISRTPPAPSVTWLEFPTTQKTKHENCSQRTNPQIHGFVTLYQQ